MKPRTKIDDAHMSSTYRKAMLKNARLVLDFILGADAQNSDRGIGSTVPGSPGTQSCNPIVDSRLRFTPECVPRGSARRQLSCHDMASRRPREPSGGESRRFAR